MRSTNCNFGIGALCLVVLATVGCQGEPTMDTEPVQGVVTLDGTPVEGAIVTFQPVSQGQGMSATGYTDAQGVYKLTAVGGGDGPQPAPEAGTLPGEYYVTVQKTEAEVGISQEEAEASGQEYIPPESNVNPKMTYHVPRKYQNARQSGLTATVTEGENNIPLELTSN